MEYSTARTIRYLSIALLLGSQLLSTEAIAANWWYAELDATRARINVSGASFYPVLPRAKLGFFITQKILLEAQYAGQGDDTVNNSRMEIDHISAAYLRLDSGIRGDTRMYVLLGSADTSLKSSTSGGANSRTDSYRDFSWGIGLESRTWSKHTLLTVEYTDYYNHDEITITAVSLGFKFEY